MVHIVYYTEDYIISRYENLSNKKKVEVLHNALSEMSGRNSQTESQAICKAMGFYNESGNNTRWQRTSKNN